MKLFQAAWRMLFATMAFSLSGSVLAESTSETRTTHERGVTTDVLAQEATSPTEAARYIGIKLDPSSEGTHERYWTSFLIKPKVNYADQSARSKPQTEALGGVIYIGDQEQRVLLLVESETDESGRSWDFVLDAISIPTGLELAGWEGEYQCTNRINPLEIIVALGKWETSSSKTGGYFDAYMRPIIKAWKVDLSEKKLVRVEEKNVTCINRNLNDAN